MRRLIFSLLLFPFAVSVYGQPTQPPRVWEGRIDRYNRLWSALSPDGFRLQVAGNMGAVSAGPAWIYGRNRQWETALLFGYIPRHQGDRELATMTVKEDFVPWTLRSRGHKWEFPDFVVGTPKLSIAR